MGPVGFAADSIDVSKLVDPRRPNSTKLGARESGNAPLASVSGTRFSVMFCIVAMLMLLFADGAVLARH